MKDFTIFTIFVGLVWATPMLEVHNEASQALSSRQSTSFWYPNMDHTGQFRGFAPDLDGDFNYPVFKAVNPGDGASIQAAINSGTGSATRHPKWLASQPRVSNSPGPGFERGY